MTRFGYTKHCLNSLWPRDAIWRLRSGSTLIHVMACCLMAPSHYLNQCWLIISKAQWHPYKGNCTRDTSVIKLMCPYFILLIYTDGERDGLWMACPFRTLVVLYRMFPFIICLILMNYLMEFYFIGFVNAHLPGCFCPWTFRLNIGLNTSPSDSFVSYLNSHLGYSAGEFQALQLIVLAVFGAVD